MNNIAIIFKNGPYGSDISRDGLDVALVATSILENVGIFFISDGVFLLLNNQDPSRLCSFNFINTFKALSLYNNNIYLCSNSIKKRRLENNRLIINTKEVSSKKIGLLLEKYNKIITF